MPSGTAVTIEWDFSRATRRTSRRSSAPASCRIDILRSVTSGCCRLSSRRSRPRIAVFAGMEAAEAAMFRPVLAEAGFNVLDEA